MTFGISGHLSSVLQLKSKLSLLYICARRLKAYSEFRRVFVFNGFVLLLGLIFFVFTVFVSEMLNVSLSVRSDYKYTDILAA